MPDSSEEIEMIRLEAEDRMQKSLDSFKRDLSAIRSTRASTSMLDVVSVDYYGAATSVKQLATISVPEPRMLMIAPFDKSSISDIEKAIQKRDLNITPQTDGNVIRLILPELSMERRQELVKQVKQRLEESRVAIRNVRRDSNESVKKLKDTGVSEDDIKAAQDDMQTLTDSFIKQAEDLATRKEESILTV